MIRHSLLPSSFSPPPSSSFLLPPAALRLVLSFVPFDCLLLVACRLSRSWLAASLSSARRSDSSSSLCAAARRRLDQWITAREIIRSSRLFVRHVASLRFEHTDKNSNVLEEKNVKFIERNLPILKELECGFRPTELEGVGITMEEEKRKIKAENDASSAPLLLSAPSPSAASSSSSSFISPTPSPSPIVYSFPSVLHTLTLHLCFFQQPPSSSTLTANAASSSSLLSSPSLSSLTPTDRATLSILTAVSHLTSLVRLTLIFELLFDTAPPLQLLSPLSYLSSTLRSLSLHCRYTPLSSRCTASLPSPSVAAASLKVQWSPAHMQWIKKEFGESVEYLDLGLMSNETWGELTKKITQRRGRMTEEMSSSSSATTSDWVRLTEIELASTSINTSIGDSLARLPTLTSLRPFCFDLPSPLFLSSLPLLAHLRLSCYSTVDAELLTCAVESLHRLLSLDLSHPTLIHSQLHRLMRGLTRLEELSLNALPAVESIACLASYAHLSHSLRSLHMQRLSLADAEWVHLQRLSSLRSLRVGRECFTPPLSDDVRKQCDPRSNWFLAHAWPVLRSCDIA